MSQRTPKNPALYQENWRSGASPTNNASLVPSFSPFYTRSDANVMGSNLRQRNVPKNFDRPLTCFYWHTYGYCTKTNEDCL